MFSTVFITPSLIAKPINDGGCDQLSETFRDREAFSFSTQTRIRKEFIQDRLVTRASTSLSSSETSLCCGEAGEKKKEKARGTMRRGKREERLPRLLPLPIFPCAFIFFDYCYFYTIPIGSLCGRESFHLKARRSNDSKTPPPPLSLHSLPEDEK